ncbi:hypothetical protein LEMLEM_LOCUS15328 [Lemmus lemmus]
MSNSPEKDASEKESGLMISLVVHINIYAHSNIRSALAFLSHKRVSANNPSSELLGDSKECAKKMPFVFFLHGADTSGGTDCTSVVNVPEVLHNVYVGDALRNIRHPDRPVAGCRGTVKTFSCSTVLSIYLGIPLSCSGFPYRSTQSGRSQARTAAVHPFPPPPAPTPGHLRRPVPPTTFGAAGPTRWGSGSRTPGPFPLLSLEGRRDPRKALGPQGTRSRQGSRTPSRTPGLGSATDAGTEGQA